MDAIEPLSNLVNRSQKRQFYKEALIVVEALELINAEFLYYLFNDDLRTYKELYTIYNDRWKKTVANLIKKHSVGSVGIDVYWFSENYKPQENNAK